MEIGEKRVKERRPEPIVAPRFVPQKSPTPVPVKEPEKVPVPVKR